MNDRFRYKKYNKLNYGVQRLFLTERQLHMPSSAVVVSVPAGVSWGSQELGQCHKL